MWLENFVQTLLPNFAGKQVEDSLVMLKAELLEKTFPPYRSVIEADVFHGAHPFKDKWAMSFNAKILASVKKTKMLKNQQNCVEYICMVLGNMPERIDFIIAMAKECLGRTVSSKGMTYPQATIVRMSELLEFMMKYSRMALLQLYSVEHEKLAEKAPSLPAALAPAEVKWLESHFSSFAVLLNAFASDKENFIRQLRAIPDIVIDENEQVAEAVKANAGASLDPMSFGLIPYTWNPIYHIRVAFAEWRKSRLDAAIVERELLETRLNAYIAKRNGEENAQLEKSITVMQDRLRKLNIKIGELEESFNRPAR